MGKVPMVCHICEGPLDLAAEELEEEDVPVDEGGLPEAVRTGPSDWLCSRVGLTENSGPSAVIHLDAGGEQPQLVVWPCQTGVKVLRRDKVSGRSLVSQEDNVPMELGEWDDMCGFELPWIDDEWTTFRPYDMDGRLLGLACHAGCYSLLSDKLGYRLKLSDVKNLARKPWEGRFMDGDYGGILDFHAQVMMSFCKKHDVLRSFARCCPTNTPFLPLSSSDANPEAAAC